MKQEHNWIDKKTRPKVELKALIKDQNFSYAQPNQVSEKGYFDNKLIFGENLTALKILEQSLSGKVKCIYIDPPYNTGSSFSHYEDDLESSKWLSFMRERLVLIKELMSEDGSIWISIDDDESHYLKVLCDEVLGRHNFVANVIWQKKYSPQNDAKWLSDNHDHILVYAKNKTLWRPNLLPRSAVANARYKNPDNDPRGLWKPSDMSVKTYSAANDYAIEVPSGRVVNPPKSRCWGYSKQRYEEMLADNRIWLGAKGNNVPAVKKFLTEVKDGRTCMTIWPYEEVGHNQDAKKEVKAFNAQNVFDTPKPEKLIERILSLATNEGDLVLDFFAGSGTTGAVAHKMCRRWIMVELGEHCHTHIIPRLKQVIDGIDQGGISKTVNWQGGGGFDYYKLDPE